MFVFMLLDAPEVSHAQEQSSSFEPAECPIETPDTRTITCGYLVAPEDYAEPEGARVRLPVIIIYSSSVQPEPDPVLYTEGGPGFSSLDSVWWWASSDFVKNRDVIILEQRGNIYAQPNLKCDVSVWREDVPGSTPCLDSLKARGIDVRHYTTANIVADINELRRVLPYEQWNLVGSSYSTRLMQLTMDLHPEGIRTVILSSVSSLTETRYQHDPEHAMRALQVMLDDCAANAACAAAYPDLETKLFGLVARLNDEPITFEFADSEGGELHTFSVDGTQLLDWMITDAFYGPARPPHKTAYMPLLIEQVSQGRTELLYPWIRDQMQSIYLGSNFAWGLFFAVNCQDDVLGSTSGMLATQSAAFPQLDGYVRAAREIRVCEAWGLSSSPLATEPLKSDIPTLVLAGSYDPITPPQWGHSVAQDLSHSYYYEFPSAGHSVGRDNPCAQTIQVSFLNNPTSEPDASCISNVPAVEFVLPDDVLIAPGFYYSTFDIDFGNEMRGMPLIETGAAAALILFLLLIGYVLVTTGSALVRGRRHAARPDLAHPLTLPVAAAVAAAAWAIVLMITRLNHQVTRTDWTMIHFGLPQQNPYAQILTYLVPVFIILTVCLAALTARAWIRRQDPSWRCVFFTMVAAAAILFSGLLIRWDLHLLFLA